MELVLQAAEGLGVGLLAFLLGLTWRRMRVSLMHHRARRFWRPLVSKDLQLVVGRFRGLQAFEGSGVIGAGDSLGMHSLDQYFKRIGLDGFRVSYNDQLGFGDPDGESLTTNLILLGGPDSNSLTHDVIHRLNLGIAFKELDANRPGELLEPRVFSFSVADRWDVPGRNCIQGWAHDLRMRFASIRGYRWRTPVFVDLAEGGEVHRPVKRGNEILVDCGVIIRAPNPFEPRNSVVIICGSYGYGSWAAVQLTMSDDFLKRIPRSWKSVECVFRVEVVRDTPQRPEILLLREIPGTDSNATD
jgi:hypothetical protein